MKLLSFSPRGVMGEDCCPECEKKRKRSIGTIGAFIEIGEDRGVSPREATTWKALFGVGLGLGLALGMSMRKGR